MIGLGQLEQALGVTEQFNVMLKEEQINKLIPPQSDNPQVKKDRQVIMLRVAKLIKKQG